MTRPCQPGPLVQPAPGGGVLDQAGAPLLVVPDAEAMAPFLMTVVSDADLWMYVSSTGGLTCGRGRAERCLFPYETDDRLHEAGGRVGPFTLLRVRCSDGAPKLWQPLAPEPGPEVRRRLYKNALGTRLVFEEVNPDCALTFRYQWAASTEHGFVRTAELTVAADAAGPVTVEVLDGLLALMPAGVDLTTQQRASALVNAYRRAAVDGVVVSRRSLRELLNHRGPLAARAPQLPVAGSIREYAAGSTRQVRCRSGPSTSPSAEYQNASPETETCLARR
ncbi:MAG: hypothetical protein KC933_15545 [Myxococcales bacterium]|nr:hypothetical protein [Myxococcales bacterium]